MKKWGLFLVITFSLAFAQDFEWARTYNNGIDPGGDDWGWSAIQNDSGGFLIIGNAVTCTTTYEPYTIYAPYLLINTDENGFELTKTMVCDSIGGIFGIKEYGEDTIAIHGGWTLLLVNTQGESLYAFNPERDRAESAAAFEMKNDGSLLFIAGMMPDSGGALRLYNFSLSGTLNWQKEYFLFGTSFDDMVCPYDMFSTISGDFLISGTTMWYGRRWLMRIDEFGDTLWRVTPPVSVITLIEIAPDEFLCVYSKRVCKFDGSGFFLWNREMSFGTTEYTNMFVRRIIPANDGNYVICGSVGSPGIEDGFIAKIDSLGSVLWHRNVDIAGRRDIFLGVTQTSDSGYVCAGYSSLGIPESLEICLVKFTKDGTPVWENEIDLPHSLAISAHPNPFNSAVTIALDAPVGAYCNTPLQIEIFDISGRRVAQLPDGGTVGAGFTPALNDVADNNERDGARPSPTTREFTWTPNETIGSGVYLVRATFNNPRSLSGAEAGGATAVKRVVYLK